MSRYPTPISPCRAGQGQQVFPNQQSHDSLPYYYVSLAIQTLAEHDLDVDDDDRFDTTVRLAVQAVELFFLAAHHEPSQDELDLCFQSFIRRSVARVSRKIQ